MSSPNALRASHGTEFLLPIDDYFVSISQIELELPLSLVPYQSTFRLGRLVAQAGDLRCLKISLLLHNLEQLLINEKLVFTVFIFLEHSGFSQLPEIPAGGRIMHPQLTGKPDGCYDRIRK